MQKYPILQDKDWLAKQLKTRTIRDIANEIGCSYSGIQYTIKKYGLGVPHRSRYNITEAKSIAQKAAYKKKFPDGRFGDKHPRWKGGRQKHGEYIAIHTRDHPRAHKSNRIFEHILVAEEKLGRYIERDEIVHHINGKKDDNRPENLEVYKRTEHYHHHMTSGKSLQKLHKQIEYLQELLTKNNIEY